MPLTDLVRTLNAAKGGNSPKHGLENPFEATHRGAILRYAGLRIESRFSPIREARHGRPFGHQAHLDASGEFTQRPVLPEAVFVIPTDNEEFVYLDRLVRTLHALSYLTHFTRVQRGNLMLKVTARHVLSVQAAHGLAFEEILKPCKLLPEQITLEIDMNGIANIEHLLKAVSSYRSRGYGIAIGQPRDAEDDAYLIRKIAPDIINLAGSNDPAAHVTEAVYSVIADLPTRILIREAGTTTLKTALKNIPPRKLLLEDLGEAATPRRAA